jgi:uncharacterized protein YneF (UPF0154 family)
MFIIAFIISSILIISLSLLAGVFIGRFMGAQQIEAKVIAYIEKHPSPQNIKLGEFLFQSHLMRRE